MLYIVLLPVKADNVRRISVIHATSYSDVRELLGLPQGWLSWVSLTDREAEDILQNNNQYMTQVIYRCHRGG